MRTSSRQPTRIHLVCPANPVTKDVVRFGFADTDAYLDAIRAALPPPYALTCDRRLMEAVENPERGGRRDDARRIRDLQNALDDPETQAIVAGSGGAYLSRILPHLDFTPLARRRRPLWALGFSELTNFVNLVASYTAGRGVYWLCPNYLAWKIRPAAAAREAFGVFWRLLAGFWTPGADGFMPQVSARLVRGSLDARQQIHIVGGCLSVLAVMLAGPLSRRLRPDGKWLLIEDINEQPYRIDRHLAAFKLAGWFEQLAGLIVGDFHSGDAKQTAAVLELIDFHLPAQRRRSFPVLSAPSVGHVWPMEAMLLNTPQKAAVSGKEVRLVPAECKWQVTGVR